MSLVLYVAGPMTGLPDYNYPAFHEAEAKLRERGYNVLNPARRRVRPGWEYTDYLRAAFADVLQADGLVQLPGWERSKGARAEFTVANALGLPSGGLVAWLTVDIDKELTRG